MTTPRRPRLWADLLLNIQLGTASTITPLNPLMDLSDSQVERVTIVRTIMEIRLYPDAMANSVDGAVNIDLGLGISSKEEATGNLHPDPDTQSDYPRHGWLYRTRRVVCNQQSTGVVEAFTFPLIHENIMSQRKLDRGEEYLMIVSSVSSGTGFTVRIAGIIRTLVLL